MGEKRLIALTPIRTDLGFTRYRPGESLPADHPDAEVWVECGSAKWVDADYIPTEYAKATPAAATSGLFGTATGGEAAGDDLVGRVPVTHERKRGKK